VCEVSTEQAFTAACILSLSAPAVIAATFSLLRWPQSALVRWPLAVLVGWALGLLLVVYAYNPAGVALGIEKGEHFPENRYDNNTVAVQVLVGWVLPLVAVAVVSGFRAAVNKLLRVHKEHRRAHT
jgi:hypothetical protein